MSTIGRPDVERELSRLKDFQRATVEHVHHRLWLDAEPTRRFLVADEVGLGKTMVARGVIAKTIDHLWETIDRIDVVYICSNGQIARQNLSRLNIGGHDLNHADRLTLLPTVISDLRGRKVNFVSFTPGTSFHISESGGRATERVLLYWMLAKGWGRRVVNTPAWHKFFQGSSGLESFSRAVKSFDHKTIDDETARAFTDELAEVRGPDGLTLREDLEDCVAQFRWMRGRPNHELSRRRYRLIGRMRGQVARAAVHTLEPDLVILDEFQRFKDLLDPGSPGADLAHAIFDQPTARVLLLSATPYKMYTLPDEPEGDDHYADFVATVRFLAGPEKAAATARDLRVMREAMLSAGDGRDVAEQARDRVERALREVISRTERLAASPDRDGMLSSKPLADMRLTAGDVRAFRSSHAIAELVDRRDVFEYWRSAPYLFNLMESYRVKTRFRENLERDDAQVTSALREAEGLLDWESIRHYQTLDPGNAKMRSLVEDVLDRGTWQLAWLPPSLPYYTPGGAYADPALQQFTKRLVFSAWTVVPKAISVVLSYEAERRAIDAARVERLYDARRPSPLLRFQVSDNRPAGMPALGMLYPSVALARLGDPLTAARASKRLPADSDFVRDHVRGQIEQALTSLPDGAADTPVDQRWYWAAPFLLDNEESVPDQQRFVDGMPRLGSADSDDQQAGLLEHVHVARALDPAGLGRRPQDLADVLTTMALAGPGVSALRGLSRVCGGSRALTDLGIRDAAWRIAWGIRSLFNRPEIMTILRGAEETGESYWMAALDHCFDGNLQAVLDEYLHVLVESEGLHDTHGAKRASELADVVEEALRLRSATNVVDDIRVTDGHATLQPQRARVHLAARFGRDQTEDKAIQREGHIRTAFNSPFWPFVLASTSVGQEGLDFHVYSHAVVHWNLPGNPVDLEQREGRVHRYKGHAVRKNIARSHAEAALHATVDDPWYAMFLAACDRRPPGAIDLYPFWVFAPEGGAKIERYVPTMPLSKESQRYERLLRTVGAYRLVLGQPRQEDLLRYAGAAGADLDWMRIDLEPRRLQD